MAFSFLTPSVSFRTASRVALMRSSNTLLIALARMSTFPSIFPFLEVMDITISFFEFHAVNADPCTSRHVYQHYYGSVASTLPYGKNIIQRGKDFLTSHRFHCSFPSSLVYNPLFFPTQLFRHTPPIEFTKQANLPFLDLYICPPEPRQPILRRYDYAPTTAIGCNTAWFRSRILMHCFPPNSRKGF